MLLTDAQLHAIRQIIADHHTAFIVNTIGHDAVAPEILKRLKAKGLVTAGINSIEEAYLYGQILAAMEDSKVASMSYDQFKEHLKKNPVPLTPPEQQAVKMAQMKAAQYAVGLGNKVDTATGIIAIEADTALRQKMKHEIQTKTAENIAKRESVKKLKSDLGHATQDWTRDWDRIAVTEKQEAMQQGLADKYADKYGPDVMVAKRAMPDACEHCKRLHTGDDGLPRIFKLSELMRNGSNFKKKTKDWQATVGTVHPHCQCQLIRIPVGYGFNEDGDLVPGATGGFQKSWKDKLHGGRADKMKPSDFNREDLEAAADEEMEHASDRQIAMEIAMDHLAEDPDYYRKLKRIEKGAMLVIPIEKAGIAPEIAAEDSRAGDRAPGPGSVVNYVFNAPKKYRPPMVEGWKETIEEPHEGRDPLLRDPETYQVREPFHMPPRMVERDKEFTGYSELGHGAAEARRKDVERRYRKKRMSPNPVEVEDVKPKLVITKSIRRKMEGQ